MMNCAYRAVVDRWSNGFTTTVTFSRALKSSVARRLAVTARTNWPISTFRL